MSTKVFKYILNFTADAQKFGKEVGGINGMLKGAAVAAGALFAADKIMDAAKAVADYALEISKVNNQVTQLTGLTGAQADAMTGGAQAIAQAYDEDISEAVKTANVLMRNFGETSQGSFDIINAGLSGAANANGDFLEQVREYSTHFREAGLDATQMFAIIQEGNKIGVFNDKAADSIKEGSIRLREMTNSTRTALEAIGLSSTQIERDIQSGATSMFDVMREVSARLSTMPAQSAATGAALADIFGGPGEDAVEFIRSLHQIDTSAEAIAASLTENQKAQMAWADELQEFHTIGAQVFGGTGTLVTKVKTIFMGFVNDAIKGAVSVINYFIDLYNESMLFRGAIEYIKFTVETVFDGIGLVLQQFWNGLKSTGELIKAVFTGNFKEIPNIIKDNFNTTINNAKGFGEDFADRFKEGVENTLNPRAKVELITLSTDAEPAGIADGENYIKGFSKGAGTYQFDFTGAASLSKKVDADLAIDDFKMFQNVDAEINAEFAKIGKDVDTSGAEEFIDFWEDKMDYLKERQQAFRDAFESGFSAIGSSVLNGLGLAEDGFEGFVKGLAQTATDIIAMFLAQSLASAIFGATQTGTATGPMALFTTPAFIATAVGGVMAAFAKLPKFAGGNVAYGPTLGIFGEYPGASTNPEITAPESKMRSIFREEQRGGINGNLRAALSRDKLLVWLEQGSNQMAQLT